MAHPCEKCKWGKWARKNPDAFFARLWRWHTRVCPGWRSYQKGLARKEENK